MVKQTKGKMLEPTKTKAKKLALTKKSLASVKKQTKTPLATVKKQNKTAPATVKKQTKKPPDTLKKQKKTPHATVKKQTKTPSTTVKKRTKTPPATVKQQTKKLKPACPEKDTGAEGAFQCAICLNTQNAAKMRQFLVCGHSFHQFCVNKWFEVSKAFVCPVCRTYQRARVNLTRY